MKTFKDKWEWKFDKDETHEQGMARIEFNQSRRDSAFARLYEEATQYIKEKFLSGDRTPYSIFVETDGHRCKWIDLHAEEEGRKPELPTFESAIVIKVMSEAEVAVSKMLCENGMSEIDQLIDFIKDNDPNKEEGK